MDLVGVSDADLLAVMVRQHAGDEEARQAWGELYTRHRRYLFVVVRQAYGSFLGDDGSADVVVDAFRRAYEWAGRQSSSEEVRARFLGEDDDSTRRRVLGWLGAIAERLFKDRFRENATDATQLDAYIEDVRRSAEADPDENGSRLGSRLVRTALEGLSQLDRDVLRLSLPWYDHASRSFAVPRGEGANLARTVGLSPEAFRQRRHRALRRLEQALRDGELVEAEQGQ